MLIESFHVDSAGTRIYCSLHRPATRLVRSTGVLLCYPLGHEYFRAYRSYVKLAARLSELGIPVMRFDWSGTGDSEGELTGACLDDWLDDILVAARELRASEPVSRLMVGGLRFGASAALLATQRLDDVHGLLLWEPVLDGAAYTVELRGLHRAMLNDLERFPRPRRSSRSDELVGHAYGESLLAEISQLDERDLRRNVGSVRAVCAATKDLAFAAAEGSENLTLDSDYGWRDARRIEEAIVDPAAVQQLADSVNRMAA